MTAPVSPRKRAEILLEALPYLRNFRGARFLIKFGGSTMEEPEQVERFLTDVAFLDAVGIRVVLVHGGGKAINARMKEKGLVPRFVGGLRVTDEETISIVRDALDHEVNPGIVAQLRKLGVKAEGLSGTKVFRARKVDPIRDADGSEVDLGFVGEAEETDPSLVRGILDGGAVPVISPLGALPPSNGLPGHPMNINADVSAAALAAALPALKLIFLSDVPGLMRDPKDPGTLIHSLTSSQTEDLITRGIVAGGMIPKVRSAVKALSSGLQKVHFLGAGTPHAVLVETFSEEGVGTEITP
jgi:acetylglutamate kinase